MPTENQTPPSLSSIKKKRNLPGMPDPEAEVIALSPNTLLATNRFICEICNKGFQRDQNLQLHRRGHNLPWKLRQRGSKEVKKKVYVCPEPSCVHHSPARALGDLTGIKKHFCRKHGEKKWKCDKCCKKYAVKSDWKAHSKICGTREYKCDCKTVFSRRDSFITHRAFCDVLTREVAGSLSPAAAAAAESPDLELDPQAPLPITYPHSSDAMPSILPIQDKAIELPENPPAPVEEAPCKSSIAGTSSSGSVMASLFSSSATASASLQPPAFCDLLRAMGRPNRAAEIGPSLVFEPLSLCLSTNTGSSVFGAGLIQESRRQYVSAMSAAMSATGLLQKAAQMGTAAGSTSVFRGLGLSSTASSSAQEGSL